MGDLRIVANMGFGACQRAQKRPRTLQSTVVRRGCAAAANPARTLFYAVTVPGGRAERHKADVVVLDVDSERKHVPTHEKCSACGLDFFKYEPRTSKSPPFAITF
jgi:hypothetical protein